jgi:putative flippase GtrA
MNLIKVFFSRAFLKFLTVGIFNMLLSAVIMFTMYNAAGFDYWLSSVSAYIAGAILNFFLNKYFTFKVKDWRVNTVILFALVIFVSYIIAYSIAKPAVSYLLRNSDSKIAGNISLFAGMCLFTPLNYLGQRFIVFRRNDNDDR